MKYIINIFCRRMISVKNIENDPLTREVSVEQRNCRYSDENILDVHNHYSYSACSVQCRKNKQLRVCNCTSHLMPHVPIWTHCNVEGLRCLNDHYEELSVVIAKWSVGKKGVVCDCLPSCTEVDIGVVHDTRDKYECFYMHFRNDRFIFISLVQTAFMARPDHCQRLRLDCQTYPRRDTNGM